MSAPKTKGDKLGKSKAGLSFLATFCQRLIPIHGNRKYLVILMLSVFCTQTQAFVAQDPLFNLYEEGYGSCSIDDDSDATGNPAAPLADNGLETIEGLPPKIATGEGNNAASYAVVRRFYDTVHNSMDYLRLFERAQPSWGNAALSHQVVSSFYNTITNTSDYFRLFPTQATSVAGVLQPKQNLPIMPQRSGLSLWPAPALAPLPLSFSVRSVRLDSIFVGNPINSASGAKTHVEFDYVGGGRFPIVLERMYSSRLTGFRLADIGAGWAASHSDFVAVNKTDSQSALVFRRGRFFKFREVNGIWTPERGIFTSLRKKVDSQGQFAGWEYRTEQDMTEVFDSKGKLVAVRSPSGLVQTFSRDVNGRLISLTDPAGRVVTFSYIANGQIQSVRLPGGGSILYQYDSLDNLIAVTRPNGTTRRYLYEDPYYPQALTGIVDEAGNRYATYSYDMNGRAISSEHAGGVDKTTLTYNGDGTTTIRMPSGAVVTRSFQKINGVAKNVASTLSCLGCETLNESYSYNEDGLLTSAVDAMGRKTTYTYDARGLLASKTVAAGTPLAKTLTMKWHPNFRVPTEVNTGTKTFTAKYDSKRNLIEKSVASAGMVRKIAFSYSTTGLLTAVDGPRTDVADVFQLSYDGQGNLSSITNPLGHRTNITSYSSQGWPRTFVDPNGLAVTIDYDATGRILKSQAGDNSIDLVYGPSDLLKEIRFSDGAKRTYEYDPAGRMVKEIDSEGNYQRYINDSASRTVQIDTFDALGTRIQTTSRKFNPLNQLVESRGFLQGPTKFTYDKLGNVVKIENPLGMVSRAKYDDLMRMTEATDAGNGITKLFYDTQDRLVSISDPRGLVTSYTYDGLDNTIQTQSPDSGITTTQYDSAGNAKVVVDARNKQISYQYDALNRPIKVIAGVSTIKAYEYDKGVNGLGQLTKSSYESGSAEWRYDIFGRPTEVTQYSPGSVHKLSYDFDGHGRLGMLVYPSGNVLTYGYTNDKLTSISVNGKPLMSNIVHRPFGGIKTWLWGDGKQSSRTFDLDGRLVSYQLGQSTKLVEYDAASRLIAIKDAANPSLTEQFSYDSLDRLTGYITNSTQQSFSYDANGNRTQAQIGTSLLTYAYPQSNNRLQSISTQPPSMFSYDGRGNATSAGTRQIEYDVFGEAVKAAGSGGSFSNALNGFHQRVAKSGTSSTLYFMYDVSGQLIGEYSSSGPSTREHIYLGGAPVAALDGSAVSYVHSDYLGTPRVITGSRGQPIWSWYSDPFGSTPANQDPDRDGIKFDYNLRFAGQYQDKETGLHHNYFRNYDPATGRYVESDPIGLAGGINTYAYVGGNPVDYVDPLGLSPTCGPKDKDNRRACYQACEAIRKACLQSTKNPRIMAGCLAAHALCIIRCNL